jgi:hypothetical protein
LTVLQIKVKVLRFNRAPILASTVLSGLIL